MAASNSTTIRQSGVALISILLLLTLLATLAIYAAEDQDLAIRRADNLRLAEQGYQVNISGEQWVVKVLEKDQQDDASRALQQQPAIDHKGELWGNLGPPVEVGETGTSLLMLVEDLQGRLNLNNLVEGKPRRRGAGSQNNGQGGNSPNNNPPQIFRWYQIFARLLVSLEMNQELVNPLIDWVDRDLDPIGTTGAEDFFYTGLELPYRSGNRDMASAAELQLVRDLTPVLIERMLPFVATLPVENGARLTPVNVNTASARVLSLFAEDFPVDLASMDLLVARRDQEPFTTFAEFATEFNTYAPAGLVPGAEQMLSVNSEFFAGRSCAESGRVKFSMSSLLRKDNQKENVKVLQRERFFGCPAFPVPASDAEESQQES